MANPPYGDSTKDPSMPTYATGTLALMSTDKLSDSATAPTGSTSGFVNIRSVGVGTMNADHINWALSGNVLPKAFPGLQS